MSGNGVEERLICALDCEDGEAAKAMVDGLDRMTSFTGGPTRGDVR